MSLEDEEFMMKLLPFMRKLSIVSPPIYDLIIYLPKFSSGQLWRDGVNDVLQMS